MDLLHIRLPSTETNYSLDYESSAELSVGDDREEISSSMDLSPISRSHTSIISDNDLSNDDIKGIKGSTLLIINNFNYNQTNNNVYDIESQKSELRRKKSLISKLYSPNNGSRKKRAEIRLSILGKPLPSYRMKNEISFYKEKIAVYNFLHRPQGFIAVGYHLFVSCVVFVCLVLTIFSTISVYEIHATDGLKFMDSLIVALFGSEFLARLWSSSCIFHFQGWNGKLRFIRNPFRIIDLFVITTSCIVLFFETKDQTFSTFLRGFRFFQVFQMLRLEHKFRPWRMMASVVWAQREHLAITTYMGFLALLFISFSIYFVEKDVNPSFNSIAAAMWWGVVTLCTVGYGDMSPITPIGKFLSCICIIMGVSIFALPAGILGTGLALKVQEQQRQRQMGKRREPAAKLIQCTWRCYAASENSTSTVTWKLHLSPNSKIHSLNYQEKNAIRFIRIVKYLTARRNFNKVFKPYDIKDVLEQYAAGHADVLGRVKHMQSRLNTVQASVNTNLKALQESKGVLSTRMSHIESVAIDLNIKFNELIAIQLRDKAIIESLTSLLCKKRDSYCDKRRKSF